MAVPAVMLVFYLHSISALSSVLLAISDLPDQTAHVRYEGRCRFLCGSF